jgi:hypothetical protein
MIHSPPQARTTFKPGLTILEALVLLFTSTMLALVVVPVVLVKYEYIKREELPLVTTPPANLPQFKLDPVPQPELPKTPELPPPAAAPAYRGN